MEFKRDVWLVIVNQLIRQLSNDAIRPNVHMQQGLVSLQNTLTEKEESSTEK